VNLISKLLGSAAFRLALAYLAVIAIFAGVLIGYVAYSAEEIFESRTRATIAAEVRGLAEQYAEGGIHDWPATVTARARRQTPDSSLYLLTAFSGARIAGNICCDCARGNATGRPARPDHLCARRRNSRAFRRSGGPCLSAGRGVRTPGGARHL
jgi:hypothetical protein